MPSVSVRLDKWSTQAMSPEPDKPNQSHSKNWYRRSFFPMMPFHRSENNFILSCWNVSGAAKELKWSFNHTWGNIHCRLRMKVAVRYARNRNEWVWREATESHVASCFHPGCRVGLLFEPAVHTAAHLLLLLLLTNQCKITHAHFMWLKDEKTVICNAIDASVVS